jgi:serine/threonine-protein kinase
MSKTVAFTSGLTSEEWSRRERVVRQFDQAWRRGPQPVLDDYLPADEGERRAVLAELVHTDLEYRLKDGEPARVEDYLARFPELVGDRAAELELIKAELELRWRHESGLALDDYLERFPRHRAELLSTWRTKPSPGPPRLNCPQCGEPLEVAAGPHREVIDCPACAATFRLAAGDPSPWPGPRPSRLGKYELIEEVGRGAFGIVYRARDTELGRTVAVKVPRAGRPAAPGEMDRFLREARNVAQLEHPHIVPVHDAGRDGEACYLVSAFVAGTTLADRLADGRLAPRDAAELAARVADALQHAHRQGVVHRDIKPSNILIDGQGEPHLTDFGLAKRDVGEITVTLDGELLGSPAYMSPEQARGEAHRVDGRSDVFSLGVVLYELLTGERPFRGDHLHMIRKQVIEDEPRPPRRLNDRIPRDLETICLKCLGKEPRQRYATAGALADDLRRFLTGRPIQARPIGVLGRSGRWCRRNPAVAALGAALLLVFLGGFAAVTAQWLRARREWARAERNLQLANQSVDDYFTKVSQDKLLNQKGMQPLRKELLALALPYYRSFLQQRGDDPKLRAGLARASFRAADIYGMLGLEKEASSALRTALLLYQESVRAAPSDTELSSDLAKVYDRLAVQQRGNGRLDETLASFGEARAIRARLAHDHPDNPAWRHELATSETNTGIFLFETGRPAEAIRSLRLARDILEGLTVVQPEALEFQDSLAHCSTTIGAAYRANGQPAEALDAFRRAHDVLARLTRDRPDDLDHLRDLAGTSHNIGIVQLGTAPTEALHAFQEASGIQEKLVVENPAVVDYQSELGMTYSSLGILHLLAGHPDQALRPLEQSRDLRARVVRLVPDDLNSRSELGASLGNLGEALNRLGRYSEASAVFRQAIEQQRLAFEKAPQVAQYRRFLSNCDVGLGQAQRALGRPSEAAATALERKQLWPGHPVELYNVACELALCVPLVGKGQADLTAAEQAQRRAFGDRAIEALRQAGRAGFKDHSTLKTDRDLDPLRLREDFRVLLMDLAFPTDPFTP